MKLISKTFIKGGGGHITLMPEEAEDMWHIFNLIRVGDIVKSQTVRKVINESSTGSVTSQRMTTTLTVQVEAIDFDPGAEALHLKGKTVKENDHVKMGSYHTLDLEPNRKFTLEKTEWDIIDLERIEVAFDPAQQADIAAVVLHEGMANLCLVTPAMTLVKAKIDMQIPRKRKGFTAQHEKGLQKFYDAIASAFLRHVNFQIVKCVLIAGRGFTNEQFYNHLLRYAEQQGKKITTEQRSKFILTHASSGYKHALKEVLEDKDIALRLCDTKAQSEVKALNTFHELMSVDPDKAYYGYKHVKRANDDLAIETLMLSDSLFRSNDIETRKNYVGLVESVREQNGTVLIFSSMHVSGEQLSLLTGCAAILRFPMPEIEDVELSDSDDEAEE
ncbi:unnamed protein product [Auanema sp. JU1783]|nr:unnamed protein product [Auanema sp. JU1783]